MKLSSFAFATAVSFAVLLNPAGLTAQEKPSLTLIRPAKWSFDQPATLDLKVPLRISGNVLYPPGVRQVLINGQPSTVRQDPKNATFWLFEQTLQPADITDYVSIVVVTTSGDSTTRKQFQTNSTIVGPYSPNKPKAIATKEPEIARSVTPATEPSKTVPIIPACSWSSYKKRGIGYGAVGGIGIVIGASGQKAGFGLAAAAAVVAGIDGLMTANRSECKSR